MLTRVTHDVTLIAFRRFVVAASQHKRHQKKSLSNLLTIENKDSDLKVHAPHYANELLKSFANLPNKRKQ